MSKPTEIPPVDRWRFDEVVNPERPIWGWKGIARYLGVSEKTARRWASDPTKGLPIYHPAGRPLARSNELLAWMTASMSQNDQKCKTLI